MMFYHYIEAIACYLLFVLSSNGSSKSNIFLLFRIINVKYQFILYFSFSTINLQLCVSMQRRSLVLPISLL